MFAIPLSHNAINNTTSTHISRLDRCKLIILLLLFIITISSSFVNIYRLFFSRKYGNQISAIAIDTSICDAAKGCDTTNMNSCHITYSDCIKFATDTFEESKSQCLGYINAWYNCQREQLEKSKCEIALQNTQSCMNIISLDAYSRWIYFIGINKNSLSHK